MLIIPVPLYCQYITFILVTVMRTFLHSTAGGLYVNVFHFAHLGKLTGLGSVCGAIFCLLNDPIFKIVNHHFDEDPFYVSKFSQAKPKLVIDERYDADRIVPWFCPANLSQSICAGTPTKADCH